MDQIFDRSSRFLYEGMRTNEIRFPLGGIGTGSVSLAGNGQLVDFELFNRPNKGSLNGMTHFALRADIDGITQDVRVLHGDVHKDLMGTYQKTRFEGYGFGPRTATMAGFPHFRQNRFLGTFPIARIDFDDEHFPGNVTLTAFNPFIPLNPDDSSIPAAFFEISIQNTSDRTIRYTAGLSVQNPFAEGKNQSIKNGKVSGIRLEKYSDAQPASEELIFATDEPDVTCQEYWYRGLWADSASTYWQEFSSGEGNSGRHYDTPGKKDTATLSACVTVAPGSFRRIRFLLAWNIPENYNYWNPCRDEASGKDITWKNYYSVLFPTAMDTVSYCFASWDRLYEETLMFRDALFSCTLPEAVLDAVSSSLAVLKSPTVLRLEDGSFYGWEGVHELEGSCDGSCTHVWNYAYALAFLFPSLERTMRELDYRYNLTPTGKMGFRLQLPPGREITRLRACVDGQMGGIIKVYRDWKLCGSNEWLRGLWPKVKKSLAFAWSPDNPDRWDYDKDGVLEGRQHHTLDMELFGPSSWLQGIYLAALKAASEMAEAMNDPTAAREYRELFLAGKSWTDTHLFNGSYYDQKIDLHDKSILEAYTDTESDFHRKTAAELYWNEERGEIKYQIAHGCEIDQVIGQWHANICGLGEIFDKKQLHLALESIYRNNFKRSLRDFFNPCRIFALDDERGTVICDYPPGVVRPAVPVPYCQECMTGFEYQAAALLFSEGMLQQGLDLIEAVRNRYTGDNRNPWNEIECGSNYARAMASYSMIPLSSGFQFDMTQQKIGFHPLLPTGNFRSIWSVDCAWGSIIIKKQTVTILLHAGCLPLSILSLPFLAGGDSWTITADGKILSGDSYEYQPDTGNFRFHNLQLRSGLTLELQ